MNGYQHSAAQKKYRLIQLSIYERTETTEVHFATLSISELHPGSSPIYKPMFGVARYLGREPP